MIKTIEKFISSIFILLFTLLIVGGFVLVCFGFTLCVGHGHSMEPTIKDGQL